MRKRLPLEKQQRFRVWREFRWNFEFRKEFFLRRETKKATRRVETRPCATQLRDVGDASTQHVVASAVNRISL